MTNGSDPSASQIPDSPQQTDSPAPAPDPNSAPASDPNSVPPLYQCPGESQPIPEAVHLARLAAFYAGCSDCRFREHTATLSPKTVRLAAALWTHPPASPEWFDEGLRGQPNEGLDGPLVRRVAVAFGAQIIRRRTSDNRSSSNMASNMSSNTGPTVLVANDGRSLVAETVAATIEGLRHAGCDVVELGATNSPCLTRAIDHLAADAGVLIGAAHTRPPKVTLRFWADGGRPLSALDGPFPDLSLDTLRLAADQTVVRPSRRSGLLRRQAADPVYLDTLREFYHAMRPLRVGVATRCEAFWRHLRVLSATVACHFTPCKLIEDEQHTSRIESHAADESTNGAKSRAAEPPGAFHFAIHVDDQGEAVRVFDERGRPIPGERLLPVLAQFLLPTAPGATVVVERDATGEIDLTKAESDRAREDVASTAIVEAVAAHRGRVVTADSRRQSIHAAMRASAAILAGGPSGRFWFGGAQSPSADALRTLTYLLTILSQSDRPLSIVAAEATNRHDSTSRRRPTVNKVP